jgi:hypothetical protein
MKTDIRPFIPDDAFDWLVGFVKPDMRVFEYGSGKSTLWFGQNVGQVVTVDRVQKCYEICARELEEQRIHNVEYVLKPDQGGNEDVAGYSKLIHEYDDFDLVFVDGHYRKACMEECYTKAKYAIFMDNTDSIGYLDAYNVMKSWSDGEIINFFGYGWNPYTNKELHDPKNPEQSLKWGAAVWLRRVSVQEGKGND